MKLVYASGEDKKNGWTLSFSFLKRVQAEIERFATDEYVPSLEEVEATLLAVKRLEIIEHYKEKVGNIQRGDKVGEAFSGTIGIIADIQYEHDRYQLENVSGWRYGINNIAKID